MYQLIHKTEHRYEYVYKQWERFINVYVSMFI